MYAYSKIMPDRKNFFESTEGRTYVRCQTEQRHSKKLLDLLYGDLPKDIDGWQKRIKQNTKKIKTSELADEETDFVEVDLVINFYLEDYRKLKR